MKLVYGGYTDTDKKLIVEYGIMTSMASLQGKNGFVDDGSAVIERVLEVKSEKLAASVKQLEDIYEIDRTVKVLLDNGFEKVDF